MNNLFVLLVRVLLVFSASSMSAQAQTNFLTPNNVNMTGDIPAGYRNLVFNVSDGNWASPIKLPTSGDRRDGDKIEIRSTAAWSSVVWQRATDVPLGTLTLSTGGSLAYKYDAPTRTWRANVPTFSGTLQGDPISVVSGANQIVRVELLPGQSASKIVLPSTAYNDALVLISSKSSTKSSVDTANMYYAYRAPLRSSDAYAYQFKTNLNNKWVMLKGAENRLTPIDLLSGNVMPALTAPLTRFNVPAGSSLGSVALPATANDRDRIILTSAANGRVQIKGTISGLGTQTLGQNQTYEFMWDASVPTANKWKSLQMPNTALRAGDLLAGAMPAVTTPLTTVEATDASFNALVQLPNSFLAGDRVVIKSTASRSFQVSGTGMSSVAILTQKEEVEFRATAQGWSRYTDTIRIMLLASQPLVQQLGLDAVATRQDESLRLSNEALANSNAKFRYQKAGAATVSALGGSLADALNAMRSNTTVAALRKTNAADVVYYDGLESGSCGVGYVNAYPANANKMYAAGNFSCGATVMRHELGHTMGLAHGNGFLHTVMSGNKVPFFALPGTIYSPLSVPINLNADRSDEVSVMNRNGPRVASFHLSLP